MTTPPNALSIDVEDYFQVGVFQDRISQPEWAGFECRVERNLDLILEILDGQGIKATFFTLGWIAERHPAIIRRLADEGHEVGSHGYSHTPLWNLTPEQFDEDTRRAQGALGDAVGRAPVSYRAPCFSVVERTLWAFDILHRHGIRYDSSIFPVNHPEYGIAGAERRIHRVKLEDGMLWEFPMTVRNVLGKPLAFCGGGWFRLFPYWITRRALRAAEAEGHPFVFYLHPWELDPDQPRLKDRTTRLGRFRHYVNLRKTEKRFRALVSDFRFGPLEEVFRWYEEGGAEGEVREVLYGGEPEAATRS